MENEIEKSNSTNDTEVTETVEVIETDGDDNGNNAETDTVESLKQKNQELYEQLKKAKGFVRGEDGKWVKKETAKPEPKETRSVATQKSDKELSQTDLYALIKNNVAEEDIQEVVDYAKLKKISVAEAVKNSFVKSLLKDKEEQRRVANATNTGTVRRSNPKVSDESLVSRAQKGELPDGEDDISRLVEARMNARRAKK